MAPVVGPKVYDGLAAAVLIAHLLWILWVILGALASRRYRALTWPHILSLGYGIVIEIGPWPCPLTALEQHLQRRAGITPYTQSFLVHYLEALVYPDVPAALLAGCAVAVCSFNLCVYAIRFLRGNGSTAASPGTPSRESPTGFRSSNARRPG
jgi:hypothetical protein